MSTNSELATIFHTMATILEIKGESGFKINATMRVARVLEEMVEDVGSIEDITKIDGIGKSSAHKINQYIEHGKIEEYDAIVQSIPSGLLDVMKVQGLGPKSVRLLWQEADVVDIPTLKLAIDEGRLASLPRMGEKTIQNIAESLTFLESSADRTRLGDAMPIAQAMVQALGALNGITEISYAGSLRRGKETIGDIDILASTSDADLLATTFCQLSDVSKVLAHGETKCSIRLDTGMQVDLRIVDQGDFGAALLYFTGSKEHNVRLRERAMKQGKKLNEYGLFHAGEDDSASIARSEESIYADLGLPWIPPEMREDRGELDCQSTPLLISQEDILSDLHCHTYASDGHMSIEELAMLAVARGFHTIAVTDHSQSSTIADGLQPDRLRDHIEEIHQINDSIDAITILAGSEVDILADGRLDYEDDLLELLDIVVASPHAALQQSSADATKRLIAAIQHPLVHIIGHPTGRIVNKRKGLEPDMQTIVEAAAAHDTALEINSNSLRLDLRDTHVRAAIHAGALVSINTDAHYPSHFDQLQFGILTARRGWLLPSSCINCKSHDDLHTWLGHTL